ncbi:hypothetical protein [Marmoricola sp. RAF53]|uniref:hypothetical protein n=1 Tax=Marmoricola sp. RAF53 TaxID=3233059 RepID=UPI003F997D5E
MSTITPEHAAILRDQTTFEYPALITGADSAELVDGTDLALASAIQNVLDGCCRAEQPEVLQHVAEHLVRAAGLAAARELIEDMKGWGE